MLIAGFKDSIESEILTVGLPIPRQSGENGVFGYVFDSFHHAGEKFSILFLARRESHSAIAEERSSDTVPGNWSEEWVPILLVSQKCVCRSTKPGVT